MEDLTRLNFVHASIGSSDCHYWYYSENIGPDVCTGCDTSLSNYGGIYHYGYPPITKKWSTLGSNLHRNNLQN